MSLSLRQLGKCPVGCASVLQEGKYKIWRKVGRGARGIVFAARCCREADGQEEGSDCFSQAVALKIAAGMEEFAKDLHIAREGLCATFGAPTIMEAFPLPQVPWACLVMELVGPNLNQSWQGYCGNEAKCRDVARAVLAGLAGAHAHGVVHCDVTSANICEVRDPESSGWKLVDWNSSAWPREKDGSVTATRCGRRGAYWSQSPEMAAGLKWGIATDLWSLGVTLAQLYLGPVWSEKRPGLFDIGGDDLLEQIEDVLGPLPKELRPRNQYRWGNEFGLTGDKTRLFARFPPLFSSLLQSLLNFDPQKRITAARALQHPWIVTEPSGDEGADLQRWMARALEAEARADDVTRSCMRSAVKWLARRGGSYSVTAQAFLERMVRMGIRPERDTFTIVVEACAQAGSPRLAEDWLLQPGGMLDEGHVMRERTFSVVVHAYAAENLDAALAFMHRLLVRGVRLSIRLFSDLAGRYVRCGDVNKVDTIAAWVFRYQVVVDRRFLALVAWAHAKPSVHQEVGCTEMVLRQALATIENDLEIDEALFRALELGLGVGPAYELCHEHGLVLGAPRKGADYTPGMPRCCPTLHHEGVMREEGLLDTVAYDRWVEADAIERRIDPDDGEVCTRARLREKYSAETPLHALIAYWWFTCWPPECSDNREECLVEDNSCLGCYAQDVRVLSRIDPDDGEICDRARVEEKYASMYSKDEIDWYWHVCCLSRKMHEPGSTASPHERRD